MQSAVQPQLALLELNTETEEKKKKIQKQKENVFMNLKDQLQIKVGLVDQVYGA